MLNGRAILYVPLETLSAVASTPSIFTAVTVSFKEPSEIYPREFTSPATVVIITEVEFVIFASSVVMSTLLPSASFSSIPKSSTNAPLVPDPSSRERMVISPDAPVWSALSAVLSFPLLPHPTMVPSANVATRSVAAISFNFIFDLLFVW